MQYLGCIGLVKWQMYKMLPIREILRIAAGLPFIPLYLPILVSGMSGRILHSGCSFPVISNCLFPGHPRIFFFFYSKESPAPAPDAGFFLKNICIPQSLTTTSIWQSLSRHPGRPSFFSSSCGFFQQIIPHIRKDKGNLQIY